MIVKVAAIQPVYNHQKKNSQSQPQNTLHKDKSNSFACILESKIKSGDQK
ncbi:MAG: hypothetical protein H6Q72_3131 [Firmicutes bacterium]|nr:hypothetical protein [Bacillota bacterium]